MACNNSLHVLHEVVDTDQPVVIVNRLSGGFLWNAGDLQLGWAEYDLKAENGTVHPTGSYLWRLYSERVNGGTVYRIRTNAGADPGSQTQCYWTVNTTVAPWKSGILWKEWAEAVTGRTPSAGTSSPPARAGSRSSPTTRGSTSSA